MRLWTVDFLLLLFWHLFFQAYLQTVTYYFSCYTCLLYTSPSLHGLAAVKEWQVFCSQRSVSSPVYLELTVHSLWPLSTHLQIVGIAATYLQVYYNALNLSTKEKGQFHYSTQHCTARKLPIFVDKFLTSSRVSKLFGSCNPTVRYTRGLGSSIVLCTSCWHSQASYERTTSKT